MGLLGFPRRVYNGVKRRALRRLAPSIRQAFFADLVRHTNNFGNTTWLGNPIWQNVLDLWTIQEAIYEVKPALLIECGTNRGGSSFFYGQLFDLMGRGRVVTIDIEKLHDLAHPRVKYLIGSSVAPDIVAEVQRDVDAADGPVMVILDSDHSETHVRNELKAYASMVTPGSFLLVEDGVMDTLPELRGPEPGPLPAVEEFIRNHPEFELDRARCERFLITHHPKGWLRRRPAAAAARPA